MKDQEKSDGFFKLRLYINALLAVGSKIDWVDFGASESYLNRAENYCDTFRGFPIQKSSFTRLRIKKPLCFKERMVR